MPESFFLNAKLLYKQNGIESKILSDDNFFHQSNEGRFKGATFSTADIAEQNLRNTSLDAIRPEEYRNLRNNLSGTANNNFLDDITINERLTQANIGALLDGTGDITVRTGNAMQLMRFSKILELGGQVGGVVGVGVAAYNAYKAYESGDTQGAIDIITTFAVSELGSVAGGSLAGLGVAVLGSVDGNQ